MAAAPWRWSRQKAPGLIGSKGWHQGSPKGPCRSLADSWALLPRESLGCAGQLGSPSFVACQDLHSGAGPPGQSCSLYSWLLFFLCSHPPVLAALFQKTFPHTRRKQDIWEFALPLPCLSLGSPWSVTKSTDYELWLLHPRDA